MALAPRRWLLVALAIVLVLAFFIYSPPVDPARFKHVIPQHPSVSTEDDADKPSNKGAGASDDENTGTPPLNDEESAYIPTVDPDNNEKEPDEHLVVDDDETPDPSSPTKSEKPGSKTSQMHFLVPASNTNNKLCYNLISAAANRYPVPMLLGWHGKGLFSAKVTHLAKLRAIEVYLDNLDEKEDDDLVLIVDGYDILMQLPPDVMISRYYEIRDAADKRLAESLGMSVEQAHEKGFRQTIFWGPDKICWPIDWNEPRCWAVPLSNLPDKAFGPKSGNGEMYYNDPRWLNSGTVIGPVSDFRDYVHDAMAEINATYDEDFYASESDQYYLANIWGRQEYYRLQEGAKGGQVPGEEGKRRPPKLREEGQQTEFHIAIEYESSLFQTKAGYEPFFGYRQFDKPGYNTAMDVDMFDEGNDFEPYDIAMPANVQHSLGKIYDAIPEAHPGSTSKDWLASAKLGTNYVSRHIYALWHCTASKEWIDGEYRKLWFFPYASSLIKAGITAFQKSSSIADEEIAGRQWVAKTVYPDSETLQDPLGGAWSDEHGLSFVPFKEMCGEYYDTLFDGDDMFKATK